MHPKKSFPFAVELTAVVFTAFFLLGCDQAAAQNRAAKKSKTVPTNPVDGDRAFSYLERVCAIGPRISGSQGMATQQSLLEEHFSKLGATCELQEFTGRHPETGTKVTFANFIAKWNPDAKDRVLLSCHYDTRPFPDEDPNPAARQRPFLGANDGASGVALLMELGHHMPSYSGSVGVDFVFFDAEEFVFDRFRDRYFLGSEHFATTYYHSKRTYEYRAAIVVDMIGDANLQIYQEKKNVAWKESKPLVDEVWGIAKNLGVKEFIARTRHDIRDDHLSLRNIAKIPTCEIIDFDYPKPGARMYWHTTQDTPDKCSGESLSKVGFVLWEWLQTK